MNEKRCGTCGMWKTSESFYKDKSQKDGLDRRCKECAKAHLAAYKARNHDKLRARRNARHAERMENDPEYRERVRKTHREGQRRRRSTPEGREQMRRHARESYARRKADPEAWQAFKDKRNAELRRLKEEDPEAYADILEARRINRRLKRIREGKPVRTKPMNGTRETVESAPLKPLIDRWIERYEDDNFTGEYGESSVNVPSIKTLCERAGVSERVIYRIRNPRPKDGDRINIDTADALCIALGVTLAMVYGYEGEDE